MNSRAYYLTTLGAWKEHAGRFAHSHWVTADPLAEPGEVGNGTRVLTLVETDEGGHWALESNIGFEALPVVLAASPVSAGVTAALAGYGVKPGATTLDVAEAVGRLHPLMRHRVF
jgi:hypothetical protein